MRNLKAAGCAAALVLAIAGCGGDDDGEDTTQAETAPGNAAPATTSEGTDTGGAERPNNDPVVEEDLGTKSVGKLKVTETDFAIDRSEQALLTEGVWTVKVVNRGQQTHALDIEGPNGETEVGEIAPGESKVARAYLVSGDYELYCPIGDHADRGMRVTLPVGRGNPE